ncbi:MAG: hypothetical protein WKF37_04770 [Bryobacteraceae bacterium]
MVGRILRLLSYLFHAVLALFMMGIAVVSMSSGQPLRLDMLPWKGGETSTWLLWAGLFGLLSILLAVTGRVQFLFPLYALGVLSLMVRGFLLQPYTFENKQSFYQVLYLIGAAFLAFLISLTLLIPKKNTALKTRAR